MRSGAGSAWRLAVAERTIAATFGVYAVGWLYAVAGSAALVHLGVERSNAVAWATLTTYPLMLGGALGAFAIRSSGRMWAMLLGLAIAFALAARLLA